MVKRILMSVLPAAVLLSVGVSAVEIEPPGPAYYGPSWRAGSGPYWSQDLLAPGPRRYGAHPEWAEVFPSGPVGYGTNFPAASMLLPPGPAHYGFRPGHMQAFPQGPVHYGQPPVRNPYHGYPYPSCGPQEKGAADAWLRHTVELPALRPQGGTNVAPCAPARAIRKQPEKPAPQPLHSEQQQAPRQAARPVTHPAYAPATSAGRDSYQQQGSMIYGPEGTGYHSFGHPSWTGATYERYGNMLYGANRRCRLSGNVALCW
jgi:hypothetical protein